MLERDDKNLAGAKPQEMLQRRGLWLPPLAQHTVTSRTPVGKATVELAQIDIPGGIGPPLNSKQDGAHIKDIREEASTSVRETYVEGGGYEGSTDRKTPYRKIGQTRATRTYTQFRLRYMQDACNITT